MQPLDVVCVFSTSHFAYQNCVTVCVQDKGTVPFFRNTEGGIHGVAFARMRLCDAYHLRGRKGLSWYVPELVGRGRQLVWQVRQVQI